MLDFEKEADQLQASVNQVDREVSTLSSAVISLETESQRLRAQIQTHKTDIKNKQAEMARLEKEISSGRSTKEEIVIVKDHALSTLVNVQQALPDLRSIRDALEQCRDRIEDKRLEVSTPADTFSDVIGYIPFVGTKMKRKGEFRKRILAIEEVLQTLDKIHKDMPALLPASSSKFLDIKPWNSAQVLTSEVGRPMPEIVLFAS